jgi:hypothetical protein
MQQQLSQSNTQTAKTRSQLHILNEELSGWLFSKDLSVGSKDRLQESKSHMENIISSASSSLCKVRHLPREVWAKVFRFYIAFATTDMAINHRLILFGSVSHVCRLWRHICF